MKVDVKELNKFEREYSDFVENYEKNVQKEKVTLDDFEMVKTLGMGAYGKVVLDKRNKDDTIYAMKIIKKERIKTEKQRMRTRAERMILEKLQHPFIMNLNFAF